VAHAADEGVPVRFDYFFNMYDVERRPYGEVLADAVAQTVRAEELGFSTVWTGEHHFGGEGYDIQPNPILTSMLLASKTSTIRIGLAAVILPGWHPLRLAEDLAVLDHVSGGRLDCGVGRGITNREMSNLSAFDVDRRFPEANAEIFLETLQILRKAWTEDPFTWEGKYYRFPRPGVTDSYAGWFPRNPDWRDENDRYVGMSIFPKPLQAPHPPLWNVGDSDSSFRFAAEQGLRPITWLRSEEALASSFEVYRETASRVQGRQLALGEQCSLMRVCYVADTAEKARASAEPAVERLYRDYIGGLRSRSIYAEPGETISDVELAKPWYDFLNDRGHLLVGTPDQVSERLRRMQDTVGLERLLVYSWLPELNQSDILASLELFGQEVMPSFVRPA
jgi:alkanesulfonate monooxygenase SsuD/methylene tetrahydromethanopterin reductase-like flavin-dependent oxidoreductase (luciferase family)